MGRFLFREYCFDVVKIKEDYFLCFVVCLNVDFFGMGLDMMLCKGIVCKLWFFL